METNEIQKRLTGFIGRETAYWDFWGAVRVVKGGETLWEMSRG